VIKTNSFIPENMMSKKKIFVVDDEIPILNLFKEAFEKKAMPFVRLKQQKKLLKF
jgi:hypothetical protein